MSAIFPSCSGNPGMRGCGSAGRQALLGFPLRQETAEQPLARALLSPRASVPPWLLSLGNSLCCPSPSPLRQLLCPSPPPQPPPPSRPAPRTCKRQSPPAPSTGLLGQNQGGWGFWRGRCNAETTWRGRMGITLEGREREVHSLKKKKKKNQSAFVSSAAGGTTFY